MENNKHLRGEWTASAYMNEVSIYCPAQKVGIAKMIFSQFPYKEETVIANAERIVKCVNEYDKLKGDMDLLIDALKINNVTLKYFRTIQLPNPGAREISESQLKSNEELIKNLNQ